ncbi:MAG: hypothetical protein Q8P15_03950 [Nanoarchaeota archaeon]|nr:hypothetical protein [Nanoarchaeota archaeon]
MKPENKHGELTTTQLVTIIILIVSFVIILFLLFRLDLGGTTDKEICRNSVVLLEKSIIGGSLDCRTNYVTISTENKEEIMKSIAEEMSTCWWQFGDGKINYGTPQGSSVKYALCSVIEFDEKTQEKVSEISYLELYNFLSTENKSNSQTYLQYLYGIREIGSFIPQEQVKVIIGQDKILTNEKYSVVTGIDDNISPFPDEFLKVYIIPTAETSSRLETKREFLTKA